MTCENYMNFKSECFIGRQPHSPGYMRFLCCKQRVELLWQKTCGPKSLKYLLSGPLQSKFSDPWSRKFTSQVSFSILSFILHSLCLSSLPPVRLTCLPIFSVNASALCTTQKSKARRGALAPVQKHSHPQPAAWQSDIHALRLVSAVKKERFSRKASWTGDIWVGLKEVRAWQSFQTAGQAEQRWAAGKPHACSWSTSHADSMVDSKRKDGNRAESPITGM